jgi:hypothetical protein
VLQATQLGHCEQNSVPVRIFLSGSSQRCLRWRLWWRSDFGASWEGHSQGPTARTAGDPRLYLRCRVESKFSVPERSVECSVCVRFGQAKTRQAMDQIIPRDSLLIMHNMINKLWRALRHEPHGVVEQMADA